MYNIYLKYPTFFTKRTYQTNTIIFNENDKCQSIGIILKGKVQINTYTFEENNYTINIMYEKDSFGESLIFSSNPCYLGNVISVNQSTIAFISYNNLLSLLKKDKESLECFLTILSNKTIAIQNRVKILSQKSIRDKIMFYLTQIAHHQKTNIIKIQSKEDLAKLLNIPRPSLSRELITLKKDHIIKYDRYYIYLL